VSAWTIGAVTLLYIATAISLWLEGRSGMCVTFIGYALANVGLIWEVM